MGVDAGRVPIPDPACWSNQLPAEVQPRLPQSTFGEVCGDTTTGWSRPPGAQMTDDDARAYVVGRWMPCAAAAFSDVPHAGIEFGANGRWRLLASNGSELVPMVDSAPGTTGYYYQLSTGQLNVAGEGPTSGARIFFVSFAVGLDAVRFDSGGSAGPIYARVSPSPQNGNDNLPSVSNGRCSMVGTWDLPQNNNPPGAPAATFSFDGAGNFVGGPLGSDLCARHTMYGTYGLDSDYFLLATNVGLGACHWWFSAAYPASFAADCNSVTLTQQWDNCTGGRGYFNQVTTMTRR